MSNKLDLYKLSCLILVQATEYKSVYKMFQGKQELSENLTIALLQYFQSVNRPHTKYFSQENLKILSRNKIRHQSRAIAL